MKKLFGLMMAGVLLFANVAFSHDARSATDEAKALIGAHAEYLYTEKDGKYFEVHFTNSETLEKYEISVPVSENLPVKLESEAAVRMGAPSRTLTDEQAIEIVTNEIPLAEAASVISVFDDGFYELHVYFSSPTLFGRTILNAETGEVEKRSIFFAAPETGWEMMVDDDYYKDLEKASFMLDDEKSRTSEGMISLSEAISAVKAAHPGAVIEDIELDYERGRYVYEGEADLNGREYDFTVDAQSGKLISWEKD